MSLSLSLPGGPEHSVSASDFVDKHNPRILKRTITEFSLSDDDWKGYDTIRVICRFRPTNKREKAYSQQKKIQDKPPKYETDQQALLPRGITSRRATGSKAKPFKCTLDSILQPKTTQKQIFYLVGQPAILSCLEGFNSTIFAYGQSGSGKTYTMFGPENDTLNVEQFGLIPRCFIYLFQKLNKSLSQNGGNLQEFKISMQLVQIYKRELLDLLNPKSKAKLVIKTDFRNDSVFVQNLRSVEITGVEEAFACLTEAQSNRIVAGHQLNAVSSRSHMLVMVNLMQRNVDGCVKRSKLNFGDLAGSEDLTKALGKNPDPERRQEAIAINSSLSALTTCISYLAKRKKPGYRDSPLTHILKDSLGGNSKTVMFVACSPHIYNRNETIRTLRFAQTAKKVKNKAKKNEEQSTASLKKRIKELELKVSTLQAQLVEARGKQHVLSKVVSRMHIGGIEGGGGGGGRSLSFSVHKYMPKPGPIPSGSPQTFNLPSTITENKYRHIQAPHLENMKSNSISMSVDNMIKISHSQNEEWSGSEEEAVISDQELIDDERVDELLKDEEELDYIHEIGELRRQLEGALKQNHLLNTEINTKNSELEQCNNTIAQLSEEADNAHKEVVTVKRKLSYNHDDLSANVLPVPGFDDDVSGFESDENKMNDSIGTSMKSLPEIPDAMPTIIDDNSGNVNNGPYPLQNMLSNQGHYKSDSSFSFDQNANNTMLNYLMELQDSMKQAKKDMHEFKKDIFEGRKQHIQKIQTMRESFINNELMQPIEFSDRDSTQSEQSDDSNEIEKREKQLDVALKKNLEAKKNKSCFSCFQGGDSDDDNNGNETSLLVEEYLKNHIRKEMKKQTIKFKKKHKKRLEKHQQKLSKKIRNKIRNNISKVNYPSTHSSISKINYEEFDNDTIISDSHTQNTDNDQPLLSEHNTGSVRVLDIPHNEEYINQKKRNDTNVLIFVDNLGDSGRNIIHENSNNKKSKTKTKPTKTAY